MTSTRGASSQAISGPDTPKANRIATIAISSGGQPAMGASVFWYRLTRPCAQASNAMPMRANSNPSQG